MLPVNDPEVFLMQRLQSLLNRLVGIHHNEAMLRARARLIFESPEVHWQEMDQPAYLRRRSRVVAV